MKVQTIIKDLHIKCKSLMVKWNQEINMKPDKS